MARAIVVLADGFEEIEAVTPVDILRRAGVEVELVGLEQQEVTGSHQMVVQADRVLAEREDADAVVLPGGLPGAENLAASQRLAGVLRDQVEKGRIVAAICASPAYVLVKYGILDGRRATCYPSCKDRFREGATWVDEPVVRAGSVITSQGPGTAFAFALALARELAGADKADHLAGDMCYRA